MASRSSNEMDAAAEDDDQPESSNFLSDEEISSLWQDTKFPVSLK